MAQATETTYTLSCDRCGVIDAKVGGQPEGWSNVSVDLPPAGSSFGMMPGRYHGHRHDLCPKCAEEHKTFFGTHPAAARVDKEE